MRHFFISVGIFSFLRILIFEQVEAQSLFKDESDKERIVADLNRMKELAILNLSQVENLGGTELSYKQARSFVSGINPNSFFYILPASMLGVTGLTKAVASIAPADSFLILAGFFTFTAVSAGLIFYLLRKAAPDNVEDQARILANEVWQQEATVTESFEFFKANDFEFTSDQYEKLANSLRKIDEQIDQVDVQFTRLQDGGDQPERLAETGLMRESRARDIFLSLS